MSKEKVAAPEPVATPATPTESGFLAPSPTGHPMSHCVRCGKPTPAGVSMCEIDNPGGIKAPSAVQVHGTILLGVVIGAIGFLLLAHLVAGPGGPYQTAITGRASLAGGAAAIALSVHNEGTQTGIANCRVTRDGGPRPDDLVFRTARIEPGATIIVQHDLPPPSETQTAYDLPNVTVICT